MKKGLLYILVILLFGCGKNDEKEKRFVENLNKANELYKHGDYNTAIDYYNRAIELDSLSADVFINRGLSYANINNYELALKDCNRAIEISKKNKVTFVNRAKIFEELSLHNDALEDYRRAIKLDPNYILAYNNRGLLYEAMGKTELAIQDFNKVLSLDSNFCAAYNNRCLSYQTLGLYQEAYNDCEKAIELCPDDGFESYFNKGVCSFYLKKYREAIIDFDKAVKINKQIGIIYHNRALAYLFLNDKINACKDWNQAFILGYKESETFLIKYCKPIKSI